MLWLKRLNDVSLSSAWSQKSRRFHCELEVRGCWRHLWNITDEKQDIPPSPYPELLWKEFLYLQGYMGGGLCFHICRQCIHIALIKKSPTFLFRVIRVTNSGSRPVPQQWEQIRGSMPLLQENHSLYIIQHMFLYALLNKERLRA